MYGEANSEMGWLFAFLKFMPKVPVFVGRDPNLSEFLWPFNDFFEVHALLCNFRNSFRKEANVVNKVFDLLPGQPTTPCWHVWRPVDSSPSFRHCFDKPGIVQCVHIFLIGEIARLRIEVKRVESVPFPFSAVTNGAIFGVKEFSLLLFIRQRDRTCCCDCGGTEFVGVRAIRLWRLMLADVLLPRTLYQEDRKREQQDCELLILGRHCLTSRSLDRQLTLLLLRRSACCWAQLTPV